MAVIGFVPRAGRRSAVALAKSTAAWLRHEGHGAVVFPESAASSPKPAGVAELDLVVSLGGDGTMLRTVGMALGTGVPVLGVNFGRFGYLTAVEPKGLRAAIERFLAGDYQLEHRMTIDGRVLDGSGECRSTASALNDLVLTRPTGAHTINLTAALSGARFLSYTADSMIVCTATGSTGYNLSARGPIVSPKLRCLIVTPVSPHMLFDRSLVLGSSEEVSLELTGPCRAELVVDGLAASHLVSGERLVCRAGATDALLVSFGGMGFDAVLKSKFNLADR
jgi:NAD+ kinase